MRKSTIISKYFIIIFCLIGIYFGCSKGIKNSMRILFIQSWGEDVNSYFENISMDWGKANNVDILLEIVPIKDIDIKMTTWINSPGGDLALLPTNIAMVNTLKLEDVTDISLAIQNKVNGFYDIGSKMATLGNKWYNIPFCAWPHVWFYRKDLIKGWTKGLPQTYEQAKELGIWLKKNFPDIYPLGFCLSQDEDFSMFLMAILWAYGGGFVAADGHTIILNSDENIKACQFLLDIYNEGLIPKGAIGWDASGNNNAFLAKRIALTANALSIDYVAKRRDPELYKKIIHSAYPAGPKGRYSFVQTFGWAIKRGAKNKNLINKYLEFIYQKDNLGKIFSIGEGAIAPLQINIGESKLWQSEKYYDAIESVENAKPLGWPGPFSRQAAEVYNRKILNTMFSRVINDKLSINEAIYEASARINEIYKGN